MKDIKTAISLDENNQNKTKKNIDKERRQIIYKLSYEIISIKKLLIKIKSNKKQ